MTGFYYNQSSFVCDGVPIADIAASAGTPLYVYSADAIREAYTAIDRVFQSHPHAIHYALKANSTMAIVQLLRGLGSRADANSGGEIEVALRAGFIPAQIVFTGVGKTSDELERAVALGVQTINAESAGELERVDAIARAQGTTARVALRVNPDIDARSHPHISTGLKINKFGVPLANAGDICRAMSTRPGLEIVGLHVHVGSQIVTVDPLRRAAQALVELGRALRADGIPIQQLDLGGGLGVSYDGSPVPTLEEYAGALLSAVHGSEFGIVLEPGRVLLAHAGVLVARVVDIKPQSTDKLFVVVDAGMSELLRPALYAAYHRIVPVDSAERPSVACDIVGPICESSDVLGRDRVLPAPRVGDLLAVCDAGAYGSVMASNYNRRPLPAEALVGGGRWRLVRRRQTVDDMLALEE